MFLLGSPERRRWWALGAIVLCSLTIGLDITVLNVALPTLAADLHATNSQLQWIVDAYILVFAGLLLPAGAIGDRYGRRLLILTGLGLFGASSAVATLSHNPEALIASRAAMGISAAILTPVTMGVMPSLFPEAEQRTRAVAALTVAAGVGLPAGPLIGGYLLEHFWWGSVFLINIPVSALAMAAVAALVPESRDPSARPVDVPGAVLSTIGLVALVYGIIEVPARGWADGRVLGCLGAGVAVLAAFGWWQRTARYPMVDVGLFRDRSFLWGVGAASVATFALFGIFFVLPQYLQLVCGNDAFGTGLRLLPMLAGLVVTGRLSATLARVAGRKVTVSAGLLVVAAALAWAATTGTDTGYRVVAGWLALIGAGVGLTLAPAMDAVLSSLRPEQAGAGSGVASAIRQVSGALGVAVLGSILADTYTAHLPSGAPEAARDSLAAATALAARLGDPALLAAAHSAYLTAMGRVLLVCAAIGLAGAALTVAFLPARTAPPSGVAAAAGGPYPADPGGPQEPAAPGTADAPAGSGRGESPHELARPA